MRERVLWFTHVFMPLNRRASELILSRTDLIVEDTIPGPLIQLCAHVAGYEVTLKRWEKNDYQEPGAFTRHPGENLLEYVRETLRELKKQQAKLLGIQGQSTESR